MIYFLYHYISYHHLVHLVGLAENLNHRSTHIQINPPACPQDVFNPTNHAYSAQIIPQLQLLNPSSTLKLSASAGLTQMCGLEGRVLVQAAHVADKRAPLAVIYVP